MKVRIFKLANGELAYSYPEPMYRGGYFVDDKDKPILNGDGIITGYEQKELTIDDCKFPEGFMLCPYVDVDKEHLDSFECGFNYGMYFDGDVAVENLKRDDNFEHCLMPPDMIRRKEIAHADAKINAELAKSNKDVAEIVRLSRHIDKVKGFDDLQTAQMAIENLSRAPIDKPVIREKLANKIAEFESK